MRAPGAAAGPARAQPASAGPSPRRGAGAAAAGVPAASAGAGPPGAPSAAGPPPPAAPPASAAAAAPRTATGIWRPACLKDTPGEQRVGAEQELSVGCPGSSLRPFRATRAEGGAGLPTPICQANCHSGPKPPAAGLHSCFPTL